MPSLLDEVGQRHSVRGFQRNPSHCLAEPGVEGSPGAPSSTPAQSGASSVTERLLWARPVLGPGEGTVDHTRALPLRNCGETANSWRSSSPWPLFPHWTFSFLPSDPPSCPSLSILLPRLLPKRRRGGAPMEEREFVQTGGMAGTSDWLVRAILFPGCHGSHFPGVVSDETHNIVFK